MTPLRGIGALSLVARRAALIQHADREEAQARDMLDRGLCARAAEHAEEARLAALALGDDSHTVGRTGEAA